MSYDTTAWTTEGSVSTVGGTTLTNALVKYAHFGLGAGEQTGYFIADTHYALDYNGQQSTAESLEDDMTFGTGTDPATSFTISNTTGQEAHQLVVKLWYLPDNIYIDGVYSLEGDTGTVTYTTRMHLMSYDFTSGSSSVLTNGTLLAHNSDVSNEGNDKIYLSNWTVDSASVSSGKVVLAFFEQPHATPEYSMSVKVKYHLV